MKDLVQALRNDAVVSSLQVAEHFGKRHDHLLRDEETDALKELVQYAREQGSQHADLLYMTYSKLANKFADISERDTATTRQLHVLDEVERLILHVRLNG